MKRSLRGNNLGGMGSYSTTVLPLAELLRFAANHALTTSIDLEGPSAKGRIELRRGNVVGAVYGSLRDEEAVFAALGDPNLMLQRGSLPRWSADSAVCLTTEQLLAETARGRTVLRADAGDSQSADGSADAEAAEQDLAVGVVPKSQVRLTPATFGWLCFLSVVTLAALGVWFSPG